jgi:ribosomal-protein-alanine N-acetyltransferase
MAGESLTLEVRQSNSEAIAMYESLEYERVGTRPAYYQDGEDAVVMTKRILNSEF